MVPYRSATDEVERVLAIQKNYYAVLKVPLPSFHFTRIPGLLLFACFGRGTCSVSSWTVADELHTGLSWTCKY